MSEKEKPVRRRRRLKNADGRMPLVEHLIELRRRVIISFVALALGTIIGYVWYAHTIPAVPTLGDILRGPYCRLDPTLRADISPDGSCKLLATAPFDMFLLRLKVGALAGSVFASPVWLWQLWAFILPGLLKKERRYTATFVILAVILFVAGALLAYFCVATGLELLLSLGQETQTTALNGMLYYKFLLGLLVIFGVSFEVPLIIVMLNLVGVLHYDHVKDKRRIIIVILFVFAAVMTPSQDPFSMSALAICLCILVEIAFQFCRIRDKLSKASRPEWLDLSDEKPSSLDSFTPEGLSGPIGEPQPIEKPTPINRSSLDDACGRDFNDVL